MVRHRGEDQLRGAFRGLGAVSAPLIDETVLSDQNQSARSGVSLS
jgi:hypothetical protein